MLAGSSICGAWPCPVTMTKLHRTLQDAHKECMDIRYPPARNTRTKPQNVLTFVEGSGESENADSNRCPEQPALSSQVQRPSRARPSIFIVRNRGRSHGSAPSHPAMQGLCLAASILFANFSSRLTTQTAFVRWPARSQEFLASDPGFQAADTGGRAVPRSGDDTEGLTTISDRPRRDGTYFRQLSGGVDVVSRRGRESDRTRLGIAPLAVFRCTARLAPTSAEAARCTCRSRPRRGG